MAVIETTTPTILEATGRRKTAVARVRLTPGSGRVVVNDQPFEQYFAVESLRRLIQQPLELAGCLGKYDVWARVSGGGKAGQAGAMRHGIARSLALLGPELRKQMKDAGLLTRDDRMKERKKAGQPGARKRFQFSKR